MINKVKTTSSGKNKVTMSSTINGVETVTESEGGGYVNVQNNSYQFGKRDIVTAYNNKEGRKWKAFDRKNPDRVFYSYFETLAIIKVLRSKK